MAKEDKKKNIILISIMILAILGTLFLVLKKNPNTVDNKKSLEDTLIDFKSGPSIPHRVESDIFSSDDFNNLQEYSDNSFQLEPRGKINPFKPFNALSETK